MQMYHIMTLKVVVLKLVSKLVLDFPEDNIINLEMSKKFVKELEEIYDKILDEYQKYDEKKIRELIEFYFAKLLQVDELTKDKTLDEDKSRDDFSTTLDIVRLRMRFLMIWAGYIADWI